MGTNNGCLGQERSRRETRKGRERESSRVVETCESEREREAESD
jgi:hypothetical protein